MFLIFSYFQTPNQIGQIWYRRLYTNLHTSAPFPQHARGLNPRHLAAGVRMPLSRFPERYPGETKGPMNTPVTTPQQHRAALPHASVWVNANAGSGKTYVLVNRIARLLLAGADPASIVCLTYTNAAATEMEARVHKLLGTWTFMDEKALGVALRGLGAPHVDRKMIARARRLFSLSQETPGGFRIQTIHAFCEKVLQLFPVEAGVTPGFKVLDDSRKALLLAQAREQVLAEAAGEGNPLMAQAMAIITRHAKADDVDQLIDTLIAKFGDALDWEACSLALRAAFGLGKAASADEIADGLTQCDQKLLARAFDALEESQENKDRELLQQLRSLHAPQAQARALLARSCFMTGKLELKSIKSLGSSALKKKHAWFMDFIAAEQQRICALIEQHDAFIRVEATAALALLARQIISVYEEKKRGEGLHSFDDLIKNTHLLLSGTDASEWILYKLDRGIEHILIDEAQDTSPPQWGVVEALSREFFVGEGAHDKKRTLFVVGDPKQSIFSFQGADTRAFSRYRGSFGTAVAQAGQGEKFDVDLTVSYRSTETVLQVVDAVFAAGTPARKGLAIDGHDGLTHVTDRKGAPGIFEIWPPVSVAKEELPDPWTPPTRAMQRLSHRRLLARKIARAIKSWIGTRQLAARGRAVQPGDILILFRRRKVLFYTLINELRAAGIPVAGADRLKPHENLAARDVLAFIHALTLASDDHALACVLKSPLVSTPLSEDQLFRLAHDRGTATLWDRLASSEDQACKALHAELARWRDLMPAMRPYEFLSALLLQRRKAILARLGSEAGDAVDAMLEAALAYEDAHPASVSGFANWFETEEMTVKRDMEQGRDEVRLMTAHGAKGLEANIVILADAAEAPDDKRGRSLMIIEAEEDRPPLPLWSISGLARSSHVDRWKALARDREHEEYCRLLYVAMTRACDELYVCGSSSKEDGAPGDRSWYGMVHAALHAPSCAIKLREVETQDGERCHRHGSDPDTIEAQSSSPSVQAGLPAWLLSAPALPQRASLLSPSSLGVKSVTHSAEAAARGTELHRLLQLLPQLSPDRRQPHLDALIARGAMTKAQTQRIMSILAIDALFTENARAEVAVAGQGLHGVIDRLVINPHEILIVDYKSGSSPPEGIAADHPYALQLGAYAQILGSVHPSKSIKAGLLWTDRAALAWLSPETLEKAKENVLARLQESVT
jgi:ATP-dependent helicase/nuclease subunit A